MRVLSVVFLMIFLTGSAFADFSDIPPDHWASETVQHVADTGIMRGFPDGSFQGDKYVTRFELAVTIERFIDFMEKTAKPVAEIKPSPRKHWAARSVNRLKVEGLVPADSSILTDGDRNVTHDELAEIISYVMAKVIERSTPGHQENGNSGAE